MISGYRIMWLMCMFDLPVSEDIQRKRANRFRLDLLDEGFERVQLSVYVRFCSSEPVIDSYRRRVKRFLPPEGKVNLLLFTDKQFGRMEVYLGNLRKPSVSAPDQLEFW